MRIDGCSEVRYLTSWGWISYPYIAIGLRAGDLVALEILDSFGQKSSLRFSGFVANAPIDAASFQFKPPPGADVIRQ